MFKATNILKFSIFFLITVSALDVFIRFARIESLAKTEIDPERGKILKPDQYSVYFNEGFYVGKPNMHGFYGPDYQIQKDEGTFRIALLGDSYVAATQLFESYHFRTILEDSLKVKTGLPVEILNFGRAGFDFKDMYCLYKQFVTSFSPDVTVFFVGRRDFDNYNKDPLLPDCVINDNGDLEIITGFEEKKSYRQYKRLKPLIDNSSVVKLLSNCKKFYENGRTAAILFDKLSFIFEKKLYEDSHEYNSGQKYSFSKLNRRIIRDLSGQGVIFIMRNELPPAITGTLQVNLIEYYNLLEVFNIMEEQGTDPFYWNVTGKRGHWNHKAHRRTAEYLTEILIYYTGVKSGSE